MVPSQKSEIIGVSFPICQFYGPLVNTVSDGAPLKINQ